MVYETEHHEIQHCFPAINSSCIKGKHSRHESNIMYMFFSLLSVWTVFLNLLVIISISHFKKLHTPTNLIILSLAVADLLVGLVMPIDAINLIEMCWYFGDTFCGVYSIFFAMLLTASLSNLVLIAVDRYVAVCHPLQYPQKITMTKTIISICLSWVFSSTYSTAFVIDNGYFDISRKTNMCYGECSVMMGFAWSITDLILCFIFPCVLVISLYLRIFYVVHQQVKVINTLMKGGKCVKEGSVRRKTESKAALTLGIIVTVYLLCWIPYYICSISGASSTTINVLLWVLHMNSGLNPMVYALFYPWFKKTVKLILTLKIFQPASSLVNIFSEHQL
ncbi:trace amine-associated receptor 13c-like [Carassius gibelio]|uniref:trace amine-associated receptor 13c-like n=1 Tax=Carassius gibelio TaxID=101364 RepID=UPI002278F165|nr:trace amine-associated receptor 13c-like [Carassius gibelio]XP_052444190.1 trace amine-associated receptor 13c-like [Carassius gibelio]XP_052454423.1 trace amine-associated receptor 13c-like [Carassius gibelio]XP_052454426.1 trace amine-associated receptor 13c-like [Carassius gibelio]XP_052464961.1 trace amine-associated receptor 13c-like [Carassius gibelio]